MSADDYPGDLTTTGVVTVGGEVDGSLESAGDRDWYKVYLRAGTSYYFTLAGDGGATSLRDPTLYLYDGTGQAITQNDDTGGGLSSRIAYTATYNGYYYLAAGGYNDARTGSYRLAAGTYADDNTSLNPATLAPGGSYSGALEAAGDIDWVKVDLSAGHTYTIRLQGVDSGQGTLADPSLFVYDGEGKFLVSDDDGSGRRDSLLSFTPTSSGTFYLALGSYQDAGTGTYRLSLDERHDDYAAGPGAGSGTAGSLSVGGSATGELEKAGDADSFGLELTAGHTYYFDLKGADSGQGTLADPYLTLRDDQGARLAFDDDGGLGHDSRLVFTPTASGTYYLEAAGFDGRQSGTYQVSAGELPSGEAGASGRVTAYGTTEGQFGADGHDWVSLALEASTTYLLVLEGAGEGALPDPHLVLSDAQGGQTVYGQLTTEAGGVTSTMSFTPGQSGTYYVDIGVSGENDGGRYLLTVVGRQVQEFAGGVFGDWSATNLFPGQNTAGAAGAGALAATGMADAGQSVAGLAASGKEQTAGALAAGS